jgi:CTP synthase (UTP-ammonia lyase)
MITLMKDYFFSSVGRILKASGVRITSIKIDPYLNVDAGNVSFLRMTNRLSRSY